MRKTSIPESNSSGGMKLPSKKSGWDNWGNEWNDLTDESETQNISTGGMEGKFGWAPENTTNSSFNTNMSTKNTLDKEAAKVARRDRINQMREAKKAGKMGAVKIIDE